MNISLGASGEDRSYALDAVARFFPTLTNKIVAQTLLSGDQHRLLIANDDGGRVGFALIQLGTTDSETDQPECWVAYIATEDCVRRSGAAKALMAEAESLAKLAGAKRMSLLVDAKNKEAIMLYAQARYGIERLYMAKQL